MNVVVNLDRLNHNGIGQTIAWPESFKWYKAFHQHCSATIPGNRDHCSKRHNSATKIELETACNRVAPLAESLTRVEKRA